MTENKDTAVMGHAYKISNMESACYLKTINNRTAIIIIIINPPEILFFFFLAWMCHLWGSESTFYTGNKSNILNLYTFIW